MPLSSPPTAIDLDDPGSLWARTFRYAKGRQAFRLQICPPFNLEAIHAARNKHVVALFWRAGPSVASKHISVPDATMDIWSRAVSDDGPDLRMIYAGHKFSLRLSYPGGDPYPISIDLPRLWTWWRQQLATERMEKRTSPALCVVRTKPRL